MIGKGQSGIAPSIPTRIIVTPLLEKDSLVKMKRKMIKLVLDTFFF